MKIVIFGLATTSSWGNGHATTYRSLCKALARRGHRIHFVEKDAEWYRGNRDMPQPEFCAVHLYDDWPSSGRKLMELSKDADAIVIGSFFPDAIAASSELLDAGCGPLIFYDIDTPITVAKLRSHGTTEYLDSKFIPYYSAFLSFAGGPLLREIEDSFGSPAAVPFYCSVDPDLHRPAALNPRYRCELSYLGTYHERIVREPHRVGQANGDLFIFADQRSRAKNRITQAKRMGLDCIDNFRIARTRAVVLHEVRFRWPDNETQLPRPGADQALHKVLAHRAGTFDSVFRPAADGQ